MQKFVGDSNARRLNVKVNLKHESTRLNLQNRFSDSSLTSFFADTANGRASPRAILVDLEPSVIG